MGPNNVALAKAFLASVGEQLDSVQALTTVRDQYREQTARARDDVAEALLLQRGIDVLTERVFSLAA